MVKLKGTKGCLVVHGFTGTPASVAPLQEALLADGFRISAPCLAGHGTNLMDLNATTWQQWYETVCIAFAALRREVDHVFYAGLSLGALLGMKLAIDEGWGVRALALLSVPLKLKPRTEYIIPLVRYSPLSYCIRSIRKNFKKSVVDPEGRLIYHKTSYDRLPADAIYQFRDFAHEIQKGMHCISNPLLLLHGELDKTAPLSNIELVVRSVSSDIIEVERFPHSGHVLTMDFEKEQVGDSVVRFFNKFE